jgi:hypothetical protein
MDLRIDKADGCSDPLRVHWHILADWCAERDLGEDRWCGLFEATAKAQSYGCQHKE